MRNLLYLSCGVRLPRYGREVGSVTAPIVGGVGALFVAA